MKLMNYLNLNQHPAHIQIIRDRSHEFTEVYHAHQGMEIMIVHKGTGSVVVERQIYELKPGMLFFFRPFQLHRVRIHDLPQQTYIRSLFVFEPSMLDHCLQPFPSTHHFFQKLWKDPLIMQAMHNLQVDTLHPLLLTHQSYIEQANPDQLLEAKMFFLSSLMHHLKAIDSLKEPNHLYNHSSQVKTSSTAEKVMEWVEAHYMEPFDIGQLAAAIHLSPNHISAVFKKGVGSSITEYLTARRIRQACWLLQTSDSTIQDIGRAVGLGNFSYFCQMFKKHVGLTPYQFKKTPWGIS